MAPSPKNPRVDPLVDPVEPVDPLAHLVDPLAHLRQAAAAPPPDWLARASSLLDDLRAGGVDRLLASVMAVALIVAAVAGVALWRTTAGRPGPATVGDAAATLPRATVGTTPSVSDARGSTGSTVAVLVVQAAGAVVRPGVYHLDAGSRVGDLVDQAGGVTPDADVDRVNLAAPLADGVRVWVPRRGESDPPSEVTGAGSGGTDGTGGSDAPAPPVDLNTASADELEALPGVGPATAAAILDYRRRNGPFKTIDELAEVRGIGDAKLAQLRDLVRV